VEEIRVDIREMELVRGVERGVLRSAVGGAIYRGP
jgi:hypothetical protein